MTISVTSSDSNNKKIKINKELLMRLAPLLSLIILVIFFSFGSPFFFNTENIMTIALQTSVIGIMAIGVTFVIIGGGLFGCCGRHQRHAGIASARMYSGRGAGRWIMRLYQWSAGHQNDYPTFYRHAGPDDVRQRHQYGDDRWSCDLFR